ncbi:MAG: fumarylacetoacetate hydrolase family protein [Hydrogenophaga sp.]
MTPHTLLHHQDRGLMWPAPVAAVLGHDLQKAYANALQVRRLREARGEKAVGYKVGFTNRTIWPRYNVFAPIWGSVYDTTVTRCDGQGSVSLAHTCQPRLEPEIVFGLKATPPADATLEQLFEAIDWIAPGFETVQSHLPDWKFEAADTVIDGSLHARLLIGPTVPVASVASSAQDLNEILSTAQAQLWRGSEKVEQGNGANVLGSPLLALMDFMRTLRACEGAPDLQAGDVVTTGTWTDAWPVVPGEEWSVRFSMPELSLLTILLTVR